MAIFEVAILMPVYNEKGTIKKVVKSCLKFGNLIVVNDFSNDGSEKILKKIKSKNFFLINNKNNIGYEKSINKAFLRAKKKILSI